MGWRARVPPREGPGRFCARLSLGTAEFTPPRAPGGPAIPLCGVWIHTTSNLPWLGTHDCQLMVSEEGVIQGVIGRRPGTGMGPLSLIQALLEALPVAFGVLQLQLGHVVLLLGLEVFLGTIQLQLLLGQSLLSRLLKLRDVLDVLDQLQLLPVELLPTWRWLPQGEDLEEGGWPGVAFW